MNNIKQVKIKILDDLDIPYIIKQGKYKRITIGYYHQDILTIKCPITLNTNLLEPFIIKHLEWIKNKRPKIKQVIYENNHKYLFLGKELEIKIFNSHHESVNIINEQLVIYSNNPSIEYLKTLVNNWRLRQAELIFNEVMHKCFLKMNKYLDKYPHLEIKKYKSRWGCCYPQKNKIIINVSVVNLPLNLIEYVMYHELSHFIHLNHSTDFHQFLMKFVPNEKRLRKEITKYNSLYE